MNDYRRLHTRELQSSIQLAGCMTNGICYDDRHIQHVASSQLHAMPVIDINNLLPTNSDTTRKDEQQETTSEVVAD